MRKRTKLVIAVVLACTVLFWIAVLGIVVGNWYYPRAEVPESLLEKVTQYMMETPTVVLPTATATSTQTDVPAVKPSATIGVTATILPSATATKTPTKKPTTLVPSQTKAPPAVTATKVATQTFSLANGGKTVCGLAPGAMCFVDIKNELGRFTVLTDLACNSVAEILVFSNEQRYPAGGPVIADQWATPKGRGGCDKEGKLVAADRGNPGTRGSTWLFVLKNNGSAPISANVTLGGLQPDRQCVQYWETIGNDPTPVWWTKCG